MPRLIDDIRTRGIQMPYFVARDREREWGAYAQQTLDIILKPDLPVLLLDNVADYYYVGTGQEYWDLRNDFPNLAPPYDLFWTEHRLTRHIHSDVKGEIDTSHMLGKQACMGALFIVFDALQTPGLPEGARWAYAADVFIQYDFHKGDRAFGPHGSMVLSIDEQGRIVGVPAMRSFAPSEDDAVIKSLMTWLHPSLLGISFMHCKNVVVQEERMPKPLAKKHHAKTGRWPTSYRTLVIEPLKQILKKEGRSGEVGLAKAMHICRGHFKDYREGRGLFGKYHQLVWQPSVVRGTKGKEAPPREIKVKL
jgi:hypothetical protein